jgi:catalase (peroxidase I)
MLSGGPELQFRGGRIDATSENDPLLTAPEPQGTLQSHSQVFNRLGFNQTEMIGLIACGHTFGESFIDKSGHEINAAPFQGT